MEAPGLEELVPGGHFMQADASVAPVLLKTVAAGHGKQAADEFAASIELNVPYSHGTHCEDPGASAYVPLGHAAQLTELAVTVCKYPGGHKMGGNTTPLCMPEPAEF